MQPWSPPTRDEVDAILADAIARLAPHHRRRFQAARVPLRPVPVLDSPGESVFVVAQHAGQFIYWSDIEGGWECASPNERGGIATRGSNQFELSHICYHLFGTQGSNMEEYTQRDIRAADMFAMILVGLGIVIASFALFKTVGGSTTEGRSVLHTWIFACVFLALGTALNVKVRQLLRTTSAETAGQHGVPDQRT